MTVVDIKAYQGLSKGINGGKCRYQREQKEVRDSAVLTHARPLSAIRKPEGITASDAYLAVIDDCLASMRSQPTPTRTATILEFPTHRAERNA